MSVQWYPGHMHKAGKALKETLPHVDMVIEILDARIPYSSDNPLLKKIRRNKPCIKLLHKSDLADAAITAQWRTFFTTANEVETLTTSTTQPKKIRRLPTRIRDLLSTRHANGRTIQALITGIPNVGKSTIINKLAGKAIAKTGNEPAVTKLQQRIKIDGDIILHDTPGMLWPKIENSNSGMRLAVTGAIKDTATDSEELALFAAAYLLTAYPERLAARYRLTALPDDAAELLELIGRHRGCLQAGGQVARDKAAKLLLAEIRTGALGAISFETPDMIRGELSAGSGNDF